MPPRSRAPGGGRKALPKCCAYSVLNNRLCEKSCLDIDNDELYGTCGSKACISNAKAKEAIKCTTLYMEELKRSKV
jgi:hypothetical protein